MAALGLVTFKSKMKIRHKKRGKKKTLKIGNNSKEEQDIMLSAMNAKGNCYFIAFLPGLNELLPLIYGRAAEEEDAGIEGNDRRRLLSTITNVRRARKTIVSSMPISAGSFA